MSNPKGMGYEVSGAVALDSEAGVDATVAVKGEPAGCGLEIDAATLWIHQAVPIILEGHVDEESALITVNGSHKLEKGGFGFTYSFTFDGRWDTISSSCYKYGFSRVVDKRSDAVFVIGFESEHVSTCNISFHSL